MAETTTKEIEDAFKDFTSREDIAVVLISQYIADMIRWVLEGYNVSDWLDETMTYL